MGLADRLKKLSIKAEEVAVEHKDQLHKAVDKAGALADQRTHGKYREPIRQAAARADTYVDGLERPADAADRPVAAEPPVDPPPAS